MKYYSDNDIREDVALGSQSALQQELELLNKLPYASTLELITLAIRAQDFKKIIQQIKQVLGLQSAGSSADFVGQIESNFKKIIHAHLILPFIQLAKEIQLEIDQFNSTKQTLASYKILESKHKEFHILFEYINDLIQKNLGLLDSVGFLGIADAAIEPLKKIQESWHIACRKGAIYEACFLKLQTEVRMILQCVDEHINLNQKTLSLLLVQSLTPLKEESESKERLQLIAARAQPTVEQICLLGNLKADPLYAEFSSTLNKKYTELQMQLHQFEQSGDEIKQAHHAYLAKREIDGVGKIIQRAEALLERCQQCVEADTDLPSSGEIDSCIMTLQSSNQLLVNSPLITGAHLSGSNSIELMCASYCRRIHELTAALENAKIANNLQHIICVFEQKKNLFCRTDRSRSSRETLNTIYSQLIDIVKNHRTTMQQRFHSIADILCAEENRINAAQGFSLWQKKPSSLQMLYLEVLSLIDNNYIQAVTLEQQKRCAAIGIICGRHHHQQEPAIQRTGLSS